MNEDEDTAERRRDRRHRVIRAAKAIVGDSLVFDCWVSNVSETGAQVRTSEAIRFPQHFELLIVRENTIRPVEVSWRRDNMLGVNFLGPAEKASDRS
jgi:hypothetical protein